MIPVAEISKKLAERSLTVCGMLIPGGKVMRDEYVVGDLNGGEGKSLKVQLDGGHAGQWRDWAGGDDEHGDLVDLWRIRRGLSPGETIRQAKEWLGIYEPKPQGATTYQKPPQKTLPPPSEPGRSFRWLTKTRLITPPVLEAFRIEIQTAGNERPAAIVFPSYSPTGELVNRSYRTLPVDPEEKKEVWQDKGCAPSLFGWQALPQTALQAKKIILTEGQLDCMTWHQWGLPALSIPNGAGTTWIDFEFDNLQAFSDIYLAFDMDEKGREMIAKVIPRLGAHRCLIVDMPEKDANDCLQAGYTRDDADKWISGAKLPAVRGVLVGDECERRLLAEIAEKPEPFTLRFLGHDWRYRKGLWFRPAEVTAWTGIPGSGKSSFLNYLSLALIAHPYTTFICSMEVRIETTLQRMAAAALSSIGQPRNEANYVEWLGTFGPRIILSDVIGYIPQQRLFEMMRFAFQRYGATHHVIDSLMRVEGLEEDYPAQGEFLTKLQAFAKETGSHVHLVAHAGKMRDRKVGLMDVKGSSLIIVNADNVVSVSRNTDKMAAEREGRDLTSEEEAWHDTEIIVEKQRDSGWLGAFYLKFNRYDYTYSSCEKGRKSEPKKAPKQSWHDKY